MRYLISIVVIAIGCNAEVNLPTSEQDFIETYRTAFESGQSDAILRLVKWDGVPDDLRRSQEFAYTWFVGKHKITTIELVAFEIGPDDTFEVEGRPITTNLEPQFWLLVEHVGNLGFEGGESSGRLKAPVGIENGVFYICGSIWKDSQQ